MSEPDMEGAQLLLGAFPSSGSWTFALGPSLHPIGSPQEVAGLCDRVVHTFMDGSDEPSFTVLNREVWVMDDDPERVEALHVEWMARWALSNLSAVTLTEMTGESNVSEALDAAARAAVACTAPWAHGRLAASNGEVASLESRSPGTPVRLHVAQVGARMVAVVERRGALPSDLAGLQVVEVGLVGRELTTQRDQP